MTDVTVLLVIGMAGSGKTAFSQRLFAHLTGRQKTPFAVNLDPAVLEVPYPADVDIRDTVSYKDVMEKYQLGPNGTILTCLNLFTTQFDNVLDAIQAYSTGEYDQKLAIMDTPGQIEIFTWSASGTIITESLAAAHPTILVYIVDTPRCTHPTTFMSNMLYACSILYKTRLPCVVVFNKVDETPCEFAVQWMGDFEAFQSALLEDTSFMSSLVHSMSLLLEEFYQHLKVVGVSSLTGEGLDECLQAIQHAKDEYLSELKPELEKAAQERKLLHDKQQEGMQLLMRNLSIAKDKL